MECIFLFRSSIHSICCAREIVCVYTVVASLFFHLSFYICVCTLCVQLWLCNKCSISDLGIMKKYFYEKEREFIYFYLRLIWLKIYALHFNSTLFFGQKTQQRTKDNKAIKTRIIKQLNKRFIFEPKSPCQNVSISSSQPVKPYPISFD